MEFRKTLLKDEFYIRKIVSLHYFEFAKDYVFDGEKHDFWELQYVDKGEVEIVADTKGFKLKQGDIIFHKPNEFHSTWANKKIAPNLIVMSFECNSSAMKYFENKIFNLGDSERNILASIIKEGLNAFLSPLDSPNDNTLIKRPDSLFGCEQMIRINLITLLISLVRKGISIKSEKRLSTTAKERNEEDLIKKITRQMSDNIALNLTLEQICNFSNLGKTHLKTLFKNRTDCSPVEYFKLLKIEQAKKLIREEENNITEMAEMLGYSSIHSFSRHFKIVTGMAPSEYAKTVKARV